ncbi:hypothetical protein Tco_0975501 [Tanacetum coccineum]|uniref:Uncharacterized protein n=1 Tax=Tanacetum coccineum TaxID=301880 RepID=A0ABQ5EEK1_9ASTR
MSSTVELSKPYDCKVTIRSRLSTISFIKERSEFCLVTSFAYGKVVFLEYMDDDIPPFLRRKAAKRKASQGKAAQPNGKGDTHSVTILDLRSLIWDDEKWKTLSVEDSIRVWILESFPNSYHWWSKESEVIPRCLAWTRREGFEKRNYPQLFEPERSEQVDDWNGFTRDDEPEAEQDGSGASDRASAGAKVKETKSTKEKDSPGLSFPTPNAKATSVCDDIDEADATTNDNAKAMSVHDDVGVPNAAADDNAKATSVCDDIDEVDAATDDNAKAMSVHDDVSVPDAAADDNAKAMSVCDDIDQADVVAYDNA